MIEGLFSWTVVGESGGILSYRTGGICGVELAERLHILKRLVVHTVQCQSMER